MRTLNSLRANPSRRNTFGIPEIPSEPCLLLCPHVPLFGLAFDDEVFAAPDLTGPGPLFQLRVPPGLNQLELPMKDSKMGMPIFRSLERSYEGMKVSKTATLTSQWLRESLKHLGEVTGFLFPVGPYCFRRGNGEALDNSSSSLPKLARVV